MHFYTFGFLGIPFSLKIISLPTRVNNNYEQLGGTALKKTFNCKCNTNIPHNLLMVAMKCIHLINKTTNTLIGAGDVQAHLFQEHKVDELCSITVSQKISNILESISSILKLLLD